MRNARISMLAGLVMAGGMMGAAAQGAGPYYYNVGAEDYPLHALFPAAVAPELVYVADLPALSGLFSLSGAAATDGAGHVEGLVYANFYFDRPGTVSYSGAPGGPYYQTSSYSAYTVKVTGKINTQNKEARVKLTLQGKGYDHVGLSEYPNATLSLKFTGNGPVVTVPGVPPTVSINSTNYSVTYADGHAESFTNGPATMTNFSYSILSGTMKGNIKPGKDSPLNGGQKLKIDESAALISAGSEWRVENGTNFVETAFGGGLIVDVLTNIDAQVVQPVTGTKLFLNANVGSREDLFNGTGTANYNNATWNADFAGVAFMRGAKLHAKGTLGPAIVAYEPTTDLAHFPSGYAPRVVQDAIQQVTITSGKIFGQKLPDMAGAALPATAPAPDLVIGKAHAGDFNQGDTNGVYTITVANSGTGQSAGTVSVVDTLPGGLAAVAISGTGWTANPGTLTCTRSDALAPGASYPPITVTVRVASDAPATVTNIATVSGGGDANTGNNTARDLTAITPAYPDLTLFKVHPGDFTQGDINDAYIIVVRNSGSATTAGAVSVVDNLPAGLSVVAIGGSGWTAAPDNLSCTRSDALAPGESYPPITVTVNVATDAPASVTNIAVVSGGGETNTANNTALDPTTIITQPGLRLRSP